jgi:hypothetical protein
MKGAARPELAVNPFQLNLGEAKLLLIFLERISGPEQFPSAPRLRLKGQSQSPPLSFAKTSAEMGTPNGRVRSVASGRVIAPERLRRAAPSLRSTFHPSLIYMCAVRANGFLSSRCRSEDRIQAFFINYGLVFGLG